MSRALHIRRRGGDSASPVVGPDLCRAPYASLHLDQHGDARPCCQSSLVLGRVGDRTLTEIWHGPEAEQLRNAVDQGDLSMGCDFCAWSARGGDRRQAYARNFDGVAIDPAGQPTQFELALSNACNLQCEMCNGDFSSAIRTHREGRPPLPTVYLEGFFDELDELLPTTQRINLLGGEPFLSREALHILERLGQLGADASVTVTTNGTVWSDRVERLLAPLDVDFVVSVDGATRETYEAIRTGAVWDDLVGNIGRMLAHAGARSNSVSLAFCLMVPNWHEFADVLIWAASLGTPVYVNTVMYPPQHSLYQLTGDRLAEVVEAMADRSEEIEKLPRPWDETWLSTLDRLREAITDAPGPDAPPRGLSRSTPFDLDAAAAAMAGPVVIFDLDQDGILREVQAPPGAAEALRLVLEVGRPCRTPADVLLGGEHATVDAETVDEATLRLGITVPGAPPLLGFSQTQYAERSPVGTRVLLAAASAS